MNVKAFTFMSKVNETGFSIQYESSDCTGTFNENVRNWRKNGIMMNVLKNQMMRVLVQMILCGILVRVVASVIRHAK